MPDAKQFIDAALASTGLTMEEMAERMDYKSLRRAYNGEIPLPQAKRRHIQDLVTLASVYGSKLPSLGGSPLQILRGAMEKAGMDAAGLAKAIARSVGVVQAVVEGRSRASEGMIEDFCRVLPGLTKEDLMEGETLLVFQETGETGVVGQRPALALPKGLNGRYVPLLSFAEAGRYGVCATDDGWNGEGFIAYDMQDRTAFALRIEGDSMSPQISPGDVVVVSPKMTLQRGDTVVVKTTEGEVFCKIWGGLRNGMAVLISVNTAHPEMQFPHEQIAWIYPVAQHTRTYRRP